MADMDSRDAVWRGGEGITWLGFGEMNGKARAGEAGSSNGAEFGGSMDEILKSIKAYLYDRSTSPLFGAFLLSWSAWNYKFIVVLLADEPLAAKFAFIGTLFSHIDVDMWGHGFWLSGSFVNGFLVPALAAYVYMYGYPLLAKPVYEYSLKRQKELRELRQKAEDNRLLSIEESRELHKKLALLQVERDKETASYQRELASLRQIVADAESAKGERAFTTSTEEVRGRALSREEEALLKVFAGRGDEEFMLEALVHKRAGGQIDVVRMHLDELVNKGFLRLAGTNENGAKLYALQAKGRKYLVTNDLLETEPEVRRYATVEE